jgi:hypothetical protein
MTCDFGRAVSRLSCAVNPRDAGEVIHCVPGFPKDLAKVAGIIVDKVDSDVPLSGQEGICVQWR